MIFGASGNILAYVDHLHTDMANIIMITGTNMNIKKANESMITDEGYLFMTLVTSFFVILRDREGCLTRSVFNDCHKGKGQRQSLEGRQLI